MGGTSERRGNLCGMFPFHSGNRGWLKEVLKSYVGHLLFTLLFALMFYFVESKDDATEKEGADEFREALWLCFCVAHKMSFGEFIPRLKGGRSILCLLAFEAYWYVICTMCIVLLSQLAGERKAPTIFSVFNRIVWLAWPSFLAYYCVVVLLGIVTNGETSPGEDEAHTVDDSIYFMWLVAHGISFGDIYMVTTAGRFATGMMVVLGWLHVLYCLALLGLRRYSHEEHYQLLNTLRENPLNTSLLGAGYEVLDGANPEIELRTSEPTAP
eukprot:5040114-Pyramimonas_sp.AAC.1